MYNLSYVSPYRVRLTSRETEATCDMTHVAFARISRVWMPAPSNCFGGNRAGKSPLEFAFVKLSVETRYVSLIALLEMTRKCDVAECDCLTKMKHHYMK